jgi:hypothetical protein
MMLPKQNHSIPAPILAMRIVMLCVSPFAFLS